MKKVLFFAAAAAMMAACSNSDELEGLQVQENNQETPVNFDVYAGKAATRSGLPGGYDATENYGLTTNTLQTGRHAAAGFGVFGFYTSNSEYDTNSSTPNFMYNQQVKYNDTKTSWTYEPVKYWPNEFGNAAVSDDVDHVTYFAYAPWQKVTVNTGVPVLPDFSATSTDPAKAFLDDYLAALTDNKVAELLGYTDYAAMETALGGAAAAAAAVTEFKTAQETALKERMSDQKLNITQMTRNTATGDPVIKYVVDMHPNSSVDLLWGVAADSNFKGIKDKDGDPTSTVKAGDPYIDLTKQGDVAGKVKWNFKHALARLNVQICTVVDKPTPGAGTIEIGTEGNGKVDNATKVWLRSIKFTNGFAQKAALNLNSEPVDATITADADRVKAALPKWLDYDGSSELAFEDVILFDGLKDGKEGTANNLQKSEVPTGINPILTQVSNSNAGVPIKLTNLFDGALTADDPIYVIPDPNQTEEMFITVDYDIETADKRLSTKLSDNVTFGSAITNVITKSTGLKIKPGYAYVVKIYLGIESVKFDVDVQPWIVATDGTEVELPANE